MKAPSRCGWLIVVAAIMASLSIAAPARADLNNGLVGYWSFDEGSGTIAHDSSGYGNHGTVYGGAAWAEGVSGGALSFDGIDDYVDCGNDESIKPTGAMTVTGWFKGASSSATYAGGVGTMGNSGARGYFLAMRPLAGDLDHACAAIAANPTTLVWVQDNRHDPQHWAHYAVVYQPSERLALYRNGEIVDENTDVPAAQYQGNGISLKLGNRGDGLGDFAGQIDEVRIYSRALSQEEIQQLMWDANPEITEQYLSGDRSEVAGTSEDPVSTATGNYFHRETDLSAATCAELMAFTRYYNSAAAAPVRLRRGEAVEGPGDQGGDRSEPVLGASDRPCRVPAIARPESAGASVRSVLAVGVGTGVIPGAGLGCWLVQRRLRARTWRAAERRPPQRQAARQDGAKIRKHGTTRSKLICVRGGHE